MCYTRKMMITATVSLQFYAFGLLVNFTIKVIAHYFAISQIMQSCFCKSNVTVGFVSMQHLYFAFSQFDSAANVPNNAPFSVPHFYAKCFVAKLRDRTVLH